MLIINRLVAGQVISDGTDREIILNVGGNSALCASGRIIKRCQGDESLWHKESMVLDLFTVTAEANRLLREVSEPFIDDLSFSNMWLPPNSVTPLSIDGELLIVAYINDLDERLRIICFRYASLANMQNFSLPTAVAYVGDTIVFNGKPILTVVSRTISALVEVYH